MAKVIAYLSMYTFLMHSEDGNTYKKLIDIKDYPDLEGEPEKVDVTTLSHSRKMNILGIQDGESLAFKCNYLPDEYKKLKTLGAKSMDESQHFAIYIGGTDGDTPTGDHGVFKFDGQLTVVKNGNGVNEAHEMTVYIAPTTELSFSETA